MEHVFFSGIDGSGKSTQASYLYYHMKLCGVRLHYVWLRWTAFVSYLLYAYAKIMRRNITLSYRGKRFVIHIYWIDKSLRKLYPLTLLIDLFLRYIVSIINAYVRKAKIVIFDRYLLDTIVDLVWETREAKFLCSIIGKTAIALISKGVGVVLDVDPIVAAKRKDDVLSLKELMIKRRIYEILAKTLDLHVITSTHRTPYQVYMDLIKILTHRELQLCEYRLNSLKD